MKVGCPSRRHRMRVWCERDLPFASAPPAAARAAVATTVSDTAPAPFTTINTMPPVRPATTGVAIPAPVVEYMCDGEPACSRSDRRTGASCGVHRASASRVARQPISSSEHRDSTSLRVHRAITCRGCHTARVLSQHQHPMLSPCRAARVTSASCV